MRTSIVLFSYLTFASAGCSSSTHGVSLDASADGTSSGPPTAAIIWSVTPGTNNPSSCGTADDTWSIGDTTAAPITTVDNGSTTHGIAVSVMCDVTPTATGYSVTADVTYGTKGSLSIQAQIAAPSGAEPPGTQAGVTAVFGDSISLDTDLSESDCTITFTQNPNMGIAATRIWGYLDCPRATASNGSACDASAQFLFENCGG